MPTPLLSMSGMVSVWANDTGWFQDVAGTVPAAGTDPIGRWSDQIGTHHLTQATAGNRPVRSTTTFKAKPGIQFSSAAGQVLRSSTFNATSNVAAGCWFIAWYRPRTDHGQQVVEPTSGVLGVYDSSGTMRFEWHMGAYKFGSYLDAHYHGKATVAIFDGSQSTPANRFRFRTNKLDRTANFALGGSNGAPDAGVTATVAAGLNVGSGGDLTILEMGYLARVPTQSEIDAWEAWCAATYFDQGKKKLHVLGDSVPKGYPSHQTDGLDWVTRVGVLLGSSWTVQNVSTVSFRIAEMELQGLTIDQDRDEWRARDVVILECGTNDGFQNRTTAQAIADMTVSVTNRHAFGYETWVQTLPFAYPAGQGLSSPTQAQYDAFRSAYNAAVRALTMGHDSVFDLQAVAGFENPVTTSYYDLDLTHLETPGAAAVAQAVFDQLMPATAGTPASGLLLCR